MNNYPDLAPWEEVPLEKVKKSTQSMSYNDLYELYLANKDNWVRYVSNKAAQLVKNLDSRNLISKAIKEVSEFDLVYNCDGFIDTQAYLDKHFSNNRGLFIFLTFTKRSIYSSERAYISPYNSLVPLIPYAYKLYRDIPYSKWDNIDLVCHKTLKDYLVEGRALAAQANQDHMCVHTQDHACDPGWYFYSRYGVEADVLARARASIPDIEKAWNTLTKDIVPQFGTNKLLRLVALQAHMAHPLHRSKYMILDHTQGQDHVPNYDNMPPLLIDDTELFQPGSHA